MVSPFYLLLFVFNLWFQGIPDKFIFGDLFDIFVEAVFFGLIAFFLYMPFLHKGTAAFFMHQPFFRVILQLSFVVAILTWVVQFYNPVVYQIAIKSSNIEACDRLLGLQTAKRFLIEAKRYSNCIDEIAVKTGDSAICNYHVPGRQENSSTTMIDGQGSGKRQKQNCIEKTAYATRNIELCDSIDQGNIWFSCVDTIAQHKQDPDLLCERVRVSGRSGDFSRLDLDTLKSVHFNTAECTD